MGDLVQRAIAVLAVLALAGCSYEAKVVSRGATHHCVDTRDGERFSFLDSAITNVRVGIGVDTCMTVRDNAGRDRKLCKSHEAFIKCSTTPPDTGKALGAGE